MELKVEKFVGGRHSVCGVPKSGDTVVIYIYIFANLSAEVRVVAFGIEFQPRKRAPSDPWKLPLEAELLINAENFPSFSSQVYSFRVSC
jgi:hypothetical protein